MKFAILEQDMTSFIPIMDDYLSSNETSRIKSWYRYVPFHMSDSYSDEVKLDIVCYNSVVFHLFVSYT